MHTTLVAVHAGAAAVALLAGLLSFRHPAATGVHAAGSALATLALAGALWAGRDRAGVGPHVVFPALLVLSLVVTGCSVRAWHLRPRRGAAPSAAHAASVGFACISLVTGLLVVTAVRTDAGPVAVVAAGVAPTLVGRVLLARAVRARDRGATGRRDRQPRAGTRAPSAAGPGVVARRRNSLGVRPRTRLKAALKPKGSE